MLLYIQYSVIVHTMQPIQKVFHVEHCTYIRRGNCSQLQPLVLPQLMHL
jgi:hypothetical protein